MSATPLYCVIGGGYAGRRIADALASEGHDVIVTNRRPAATPAAARDALVVDLDNAAPIELPDRTLAVIYLVPPAEGAVDPRLSRLLAAISDPPERFVLASSSGVYGDCGGARVDETATPRPRTERAMRRLGQERLLTDWAGQKSVRYSILRIAGIYGPGRLPTARILAGEPVIAEADAYPGNRIHVDDLVRAAVATLTDPDAHGIYNIADGNNESATGFYRRVARLAGLEPPPEIDRETASRVFTATRYSFLCESRRLVVDRLTNELGVELRYRDLDSGIQASLEADTPVD